MRDAIGGVLTIQIIVIFMIVINSYLAFSVNYTKAFRVKNEIRNIIEKNEGLTCSAQTQIKELMIKSKYHPNQGFIDWCTDHGYEELKTSAGSVCYKFDRVDVTGTSNGESRYKGGYYTVATFVDMNIPLVEKILPFAGGLFRIKGETALIYSSGMNNFTNGQATCGS